MLYALLISLLFGSAMAAKGGSFFYDVQDEWGGICVTGNTMRQSPVDIVTNTVQESDDLMTTLQLSNWDTGYSGNFVNSNGFTAQFNPGGDVAAPTFTNHIGTYNLRNVHFHWGNMSGEGAEHLTDGDSGELEIHFVHVMEGATNSTQENYFGVIAVLADVDEGAALTGPWALLNATRIRDINATIPIDGFVYATMLPANRDYYFYEGSLTAPPCTETVNWFVLKDRIPVPGEYLTQLRQLQEELRGARKLTTNYRLPQDLAGRRITSPSSQATLKPFSPLFLLCLAVIKLF